MKRFLLATAAVVFATAAQANAIRCGVPLVDIGEDPRDRDPVVMTYISYDAPEWQIFHHLSSGAWVSRVQQYSVTDLTVVGRETRWGGAYYRKPHLYMVGKAGVNYKTGEARYEEWLYDRSRGNRLDMHSVSVCKLEVEGEQYRY